MRTIYKTGLTGLILLFCFVLLSCEKTAEEEEERLSFDVLVLNEGLWNMNNAGITGYNSTSGKRVDDVYSQANNGRKLGDLANDVHLYGSKVYIAVTTSNQMDVLDAETGVSLRQIPFSPSGIAQPRRITSYKGKIYVCCLDGSIVKIDTTSLQIETAVKAGRNPDGICVANNKLYISNSGGLDFPNYDNTVSVFDLNTFTEIKKIPVKINPTLIKADENENVYVVSMGNYEDISPCMQRINSVTDQVERIFEIEIANFDIYKNFLYFYTYNYSTQQASYQILDLLEDSVTNTNFITEAHLPQTPYGINIDARNGDVYITDAMDYTSTGDVYCFSKEGRKKFQFEAGVIPKKVIVK
ncbi:MAG: hypothetical protein LBI60_06525 [Bacteroidales bacterium]|jgi:DNA-binding beta-propeller fold protein YncE|nr:hypothetical protein [Bacteroidales bacterium]